MTDIRLAEYATILDAVRLDWVLRDTGALDEREELATLVRVALGTDALASPDEVLPDPDSTDRRGWWGDLDAESIWGGWPIGTKNWLLTRAKITEAPSSEGSTLERARQYTYDALTPLIDRRIASAVDVTAARTELQRIEVRATIHRGPEPEIDLRYQLLWDELIDLPIVETKPVIDYPQRPRGLNLVITGHAPSVNPVSVPAGSLTLTTTAPT